MKLVVTLVILFMAVIGYIILIDLIARISAFMDEKKKKVTAETLKIVNDTKESIDAFKATDDILTLIDFMVQKEIELRLFELSYDKGAYNITKIDKDIAAISEKVFAGLNKDMVSKASANTMLNQDYLLEYIPHQTKLKFTNAVTEFNRSRIAQQVGVTK